MLLKMHVFNLNQYLMQKNKVNVFLEKKLSI